MHQASHHETSSRPERLLRFGEVSSRTRLSRSEIYRRINAGTFPGNLKLGPRAVAWRESEIDHWIRTLSNPQHAVRPVSAHG
ncbi:helix-turn-helix transcriptional regulator [Paraburkholderia megapolitana]|uniref:helix-turn-helix transcriptional regulator n=1 Tax=Paraburkholderia megapolitana TaxID=420953 RepID=UPI0038BBBF91